VQRKYGGLLTFLCAQHAAGAAGVSVSDIGVHRKANPSLYSAGKISKLVEAAKADGVVVRQAKRFVLAPKYKELLSSSATKATL
jgi:hypothetical protein